MANRSNPYESPRPTQADDSIAHRFFLSRTSAVWLSLVPLVTVTALAIYRVSPRGVFLPAVIGIVIAIYGATSLKHALLCTVLPYVVGIAAIVLTHIAVELIYSDTTARYMDDEWRVQVMRVHAGIGIIGAFFGAIIGLRVGQTQPTHQETEQ